MSLKIIFCGTPEFAVPALQMLLTTQHPLLAVYTQPDRPAGRGRHSTPSPIKKWAATHQLPVYQPESLANAEERQRLQELNPDLLVVVAYGLLLPKAVLKIPRYGAINVHPSLLPRWRGSTPIQSAILNGDEVTGVSIIQLTPRMDAGPILLQIPYTLNNRETSGELHDILAHRGAEALSDTLHLLMTNTLKPTLQDERMATYTHKILKNDAQIDWEQPAEQLVRAVRAYSPWPVAFTHLEGQLIRIWQAQALPQNVSGPPGTIVNVENAGIDVATGAGLLRLQRLQWPGGKPLSVADCLHGQRCRHWQIGVSRFE